jgi:predicted nucleic acid-binding protein
VTGPVHVFVETNFLFGVFRMPSKRHRDACALKTRFDAGEVRLHAPYVCFQEARNLIAKSLPSNRCADLFEFQRHATAAANVNWDFADVRKFLDAAVAEVNRTKATYRRDLEEFAKALGDGLLHATKDVFDFLETMELDDDNLKYNDKLILCSSMVKARELKDAGVGPLYFASVDKSDLQPTANRPKMTAIYQAVGIEFLANFVVPASVPPNSTP